VGRAQGPRFQAGPKPDPATSKVGGSPVRYGDIDPIAKSSQEPHLNRLADLPIQLHELHPQPSAFNTESFLLLEFYSGVTGPPGRFK
jgi:hypothetical protein